jgi:SpoVK/Ycf46/Vps4 family AAA+-type ATPase
VAAFARPAPTRHRWQTAHVARADLLVALVRAARRGDDALVRRTVEALIAEERRKQHNVLADRLEESLRGDGRGLRWAGPSASSVSPDIRELVADREPRTRLADLILPDVVVASVRELVEEQQRAELLGSYNLEPRHRVLLAGPPGNGKTSLAEAIAEALIVPFLVVRYEGVIASFLGETTTRLHRLLDAARTRRCVLFFDEFDAIAKERGDVHETGEIKRVVSSLLLEIDALPAYVTVIVASNHPELLDRAVWRRFQLRLNLPAPRQSQIEEWVSRLATELGEPLGDSTRTVVMALRGRSFAELEEFRLDVLRQRVLGGPDSALPPIIRERLAQAKAQFSVDS